MALTHCWGSSNRTASMPEFVAMLKSSGVASRLANSPIPQHKPNTVKIGCPANYIRQLRGIVERSNHLHAGFHALKAVYG